MKYWIPISVFYSLSGTLAHFLWNVVDIWVERNSESNSKGLSKAIKIIRIDFMNTIKFSQKIFPIKQYTEKFETLKFNAHKTTKPQQQKIENNNNAKIKLQLNFELSFAVNSVEFRIDARIKCVFFSYFGSVVEILNLKCYLSKYSYDSNCGFSKHNMYIVRKDVRNRNG